ncbi:kinesin-like protein KIN-12F isoform X2 [Magnolia sinica]|uniref:kinesin-like protein KIN-12F isoform X2 n=1 Tax=Magnolia sinica TaxID=86752 RepID=UPI00265AC02F|nr:kinesin-like protein KIN-12F isoform X2 [Magnolia sinica]
MLKTLRNTRKIAATHMNSESSRSHSVFTCVIESRWEKDSMAHIRFGRLNLVDLAGSERQKSSGAEGERLKEAANINKSLSTLGLVIMTLVDVAHGKQRHVPYRDSRLTFLLQDSLGGNSKTTIIANVSPSICSANETLSTLKFAQRAKLIQNNAKVNEDASGDVMALQQQIQQLKEQLTFLKHQNVSRYLSHHLPSYDQVNFGDLQLDYDSSLEENVPSAFNHPSLPNKKMKYLESTLAGALRREKIAETTIRRLEAEIEHMNRLVNQREEDAQRTKMLLRFREEKIRRLELLADGLFSADEYLMEENNALSEEIQLLQARIDRNPELTRFAMENIRLIEQLRMFQDFYEQGERETLLAEVSELRDQLLEVLKWRYDQSPLPSRRTSQDEIEVEQAASSAAQERKPLNMEVDSTLEELEDCRKSLAACLETNARLTREVDDLRCQLKKYSDCKETSLHTVDSLSKDSDPVKTMNAHSSVELIPVRTEPEDGAASFGQEKDKLTQIENDQHTGDIETLQSRDAQKELMDARYLAEALESQQVQLIEELDNLRQENSRYLELLRNKDHAVSLPMVSLQIHGELSERHEKSLDLGHQDANWMMECGGITKSALQEKLERMKRDLEEARMLNCQYQYDQSSQLSHQHDIEQVREEVEVETAKAILYLQEELATLHREVDSRNESESSAIRHSWCLKTENQELQGRLCIMTQENIKLKNAIAARDNEISALTKEWEKAMFDLTSFLVDGCQSLEDASDQIGSIVNSFSHRKFLIGEKVERAMKVFIKKEKIILDLQKRLEDAQKLGLEMKQKLSSLKGATLAISEVQQLESDENAKEAIQLRMLLNEKMSTIYNLESKLKNKEDQIIEAEKRANAAFLTVKRLHEMTIANSDRAQDINADPNGQALGEIRVQVEMARQRVLDSENAIYASFMDTEKYLSALLSDILDTSSAVRQMVQDLTNEVCAMKKKFMELKEGSSKFSDFSVDFPSFEASESSNPEIQYALMQFIRNELAKTNAKLDALKTGIDTLFNMYGYSAKEGAPAMVGLNMLVCKVCKSRLSQPKYEVCSNDHGTEEMMKTISEASIADPSVSDFDLSLTDTDGKDESDESSSSISDTGCSGKLVERNQDLLLERDSTFIPGDHDMLEFQGHVSNLTHDDAEILCLREEVESAFSSLLEIHIQLSTLIDGKEVATHPNARETYFYDSLDGGTNNPQLEVDHRQESSQLAMLAMGQLPQKFERRMVEAEAGCCKTREMCFKLNDAKLVAEEKMKQANCLLLKFEEAQETIKEADLMLNALLKVNENAKNKTNRWKQAGKELMTERDTLIEEVWQLKASIQLKEEELGFLRDQIQAIPAEIADALSSLEGSFLQMQLNVEEELKTISSDIFSSGEVLLNCIGTSRLWLEGIWSKIMEKEFTLFVQHQCHIGALSEEILKVDSRYLHDGQNKSCSVLSTVGSIIMNGKGEEVQTEHSKHGLSGSGVSKVFQTVHIAVGSLACADSVNCERAYLSSDLKRSIERVEKLEKEKSELTHDILLIKEAITKHLAYLEKFDKELAPFHIISDGADCLIRNRNAKAGAIAAQLFDSKGLISSTNTSHSSMFEELGFLHHKIQNHIMGPTLNEIEARKPEAGGVAIDGEVLLAGIQDLKARCAQMIAVITEAKDNPELPLSRRGGVHKSSNDKDSGMLMHVRKMETGLLNCPETRSEYGHHSIQAIKELGDKLSYLTGFIRSGVHVETENTFNASFLEILYQGICSIEERAYSLLARPLEDGVGQTDVILENLSLKRELARKEYLLEGLLFDFRLLQESTSNVKDIKDETEEMIAALSKVRHELAIKTTLLDETLVRYKDLEAQLADTEAALSSSKSEIEQAKETLDMLSNDNTELRLLLEDVYVKKTDAEALLEEKENVVKGLEREILRMASSIEESFLSSIAEIEDKLTRVTNERDRLQEEVVSLNDKLEMSNALADENEAIAVEARQVAEVSKVYAEQKEEEVKILERSVEELERTINVLERKVYEMGDDVERHRLMREDLELELQALRQRMMTVENVTENFDAENSSVEERVECQMSRIIDDRLLEFIEAKRCIRTLEKEKADQEKEIKQCKEYISELVLHAEAQASQYQEKYKTLEDMVRESKADPLTANITASTTNKMERSSTRSRGSGSPFKCISSLVQQMNSEKEQELKVARLRIEELEALAASRQKEICMLNARLARTENMTHDVIRDLLGVKLDMTSYANLIDQQQLQKLAEQAQQQTEESNAKEQEILQLRKQINDFIEERESWIEEINQRQVEVLDAQLTVEQHQQRDQLLTAQNEMLKIDKANLKRKIAELDEMVKKLFGSQDIQKRVQQPTKIKENSFLRIGKDELSKRLAHSEKLLSRVNDELAQYRKSSGKDPCITIDKDRRLLNKP